MSEDNIVDIKKPRKNQFNSRTLLAGTPDSSVMQVFKGEFSQTVDDPFTGQYEVLISPKWNPKTLINLATLSSTLSTCIQAMVVNVVGHGWVLEPVGHTEELSEEAKQEKIRIEELLNNSHDFPEFSNILERIYNDYENIGYSAMEIGRNSGGEIAFIGHIPSYSIRMTVKSKEIIEVIDENDNISYKRFRTFCQEVNGLRKTWFKEFGDPRPILASTGEVLSGKKLRDTRPQDLANEIVFWCNYNATTPYGLPRWISQIPSVEGARESEVVNLDFFRNNAIPAMAVLISGGNLTSESFQTIQNSFTSKVGRNSMNRIMLLEATGDSQAADVETGRLAPPRLDIKSLGAERQSDMLFLDYSKFTSENIRSSFRLPDMFIGRGGSEMTYASAKVAHEIGESQVFKPERVRVENIINTTLMKEFKFWRFKLLGPEISDQAVVLDALKVAQSIGAMSPNAAIDIVNRVFRLDMKKIDAPWGDENFTIVQELARQGRLKGIEHIDDRSMGLVNAANEVISGSYKNQPFDRPKPVVPPTVE